MTAPASRRATYDDVLAASPFVVAEVIGGTLYTQPRPRSRHARSATRLSNALGDPFDARERVSHVWLVDPMLRTLEVLRLDGLTYRLVMTVRGDVHVRAEPFEAMELDLALLWER